MTIAVPLLQISLDDPNWTLLRNIGIGIVVVLWLATAYWTFKDARRRIGDPWLVGLATLLGLFPPFLGPVIYMFFRPPECTTRLRSACPSCGQPLESLWQVCPYCATDIPPGLPSLEDVTKTQRR
jgi:hypothetical protein